MKGMIIALVAIVVIIGFGLVEVNVMSRGYEEIDSEVMILMFKAQHNSITPEDMEIFMEKWVGLRESAELFLPHMDVFECNVRIAEAKAFVEAKDYRNAYVQLSVVDELIKYSHHLLLPVLTHIL